MDSEAAFPRRRDVRASVPAAPAAVATATRARPSAGPELEVLQDGAAPDGPAAGPGQAPWDDDEDPRGRHATSSGEGFPRLMSLTVLGALVPGSAFLAAGHRRAGWALLTLLGSVVAAVGVLVASGRLGELRRFAFDPRVVLGAAVVAVVVALGWCLVIVAQHVALRRNALSGGQRSLAVLLVGSLLALVALPSAKAAEYALVHRSLLMTVFGGGLDRDGLAGPDAAAADPWADVPRVNVLLLGSDAGADRTGIRPDTIIVASIDTDTGDSVLLSLPRNLEGVPFPAGTPGAEAWPNGYDCEDSACMLNSVWTWAEANASLFPGDPNPGLTATRQAVSETLGLPVDYAVVIDLKGFEDVVNIMGGLEINVERRIPMGGGKTLSGRSNKVFGYIEPGRQRLDGFHALWYARSREGSTDYDRIKRQRCVVSAAVSQFDVVTLATAFPQLAASAERNVSTDITAAELDAFVDLAQRVQAGTLRSLPFTDEVIESGDPDYPAIRALVAEAIEPPAPAAEAPAEASPTPSASQPSAAPEPAPATTPAPATQAQDTKAVCGG